MGLFKFFHQNIDKLRERRDVEGLIRAYETTDGLVQRQVVAALLELMPAAMPQILSAAVDDEEKRRECAKRVLCHVGAPAVPPLLSLVKGGESGKREYAAGALSSIGESAVDPLIHALPALNEDMSDLIVDTLVSIGSAAGPPLRKALISPSHQSRRGAALALDRMRLPPENEKEAAARLIATGRWKDLPRFRQEAVLVLIDLLDDGHYLPRVDAARALGRLGDERALPHLYRILTDPDGNVRTAAAEALGLIGDRRAIPHLVTLLSDEYYSARLEAATGLDRLGWRPTDDLERARYFIATEQWGRVIEIGRPAVHPLIDMLRDDYYSVQRGIADSLRRLSRHAIGPLEEALQHPDSRIRHNAGVLLASLGKSSHLITPAAPISTEASVAPKEEKKGRRETIDLSKKGPSPEKTATFRRLDRAAREEEPREVGLKRDRRLLFSEKEFSRLSSLIQAENPIIHERLIQQSVGTLEELDGADAEPLIETLLRVIEAGDEESRLIALGALVSLGSSALPYLVAALSDPSPAIRATAAETIGLIGDASAGGALIQLLTDEDGHVRAEAAKALGKLRYLDAVPDLIRLLIDTRTEVKREAALALGAYGPPAFDALVAAVASSSPDMQAGAAYALADLGDARAILHLIRLLQTDSAEVRYAVTEALVSFDVAVIRPLEEVMAEGTREEKLSALVILDKVGINATYLIERALHDGDPLVREKAGILLGGAGLARDTDAGTLDSVSEDPDSIHALIRALLTGTKEAQCRSAQQLASRGAEAVPPLIEILLKGNREQRATAGEILAEIRGPAVVELPSLLSYGGRDIRVAVTLLLGKIGDPSTVEPLISLLGDTDYMIRKAASESLGFSGDPRAVPALIGVLSDEDPDVSVAAVRALGYIGDPSAIDPLISLLENDDFSIRSAVIDSLVEMDEAGIPGLLAALSDPEKEVREGVAEALREIGWKPGDDGMRAKLLFAGGRWLEMAGIGTAALPILLAASSDPDEDVRMGVLRALGRTGDPAVIPHLIRGLTDESSLIRKTSADALSDIGEVALPALLEGADGADLKARKMIQGIYDRIRRRTEHT